MLADFPELKPVALEELADWFKAYERHMFLLFLEITFVSFFGWGFEQVGSTAIYVRPPMEFTYEFNWKPMFEHQVPSNHHLIPHPIMRLNKIVGE